MYLLQRFLLCLYGILFRIKHFAVYFKFIFLLNCILYFFLCMILANGNPVVHFHGPKLPTSAQPFSVTIELICGLHSIQHHHDSNAPSSLYRFDWYTTFACPDTNEWVNTCMDYMYTFHWFTCTYCRLGKFIGGNLHFVSNFVLYWWFTVFEKESFFTCAFGGHAFHKLRVWSILKHKACFLLVFFLLHTNWPIYPLIRYNVHV